MKRLAMIGLLLLAGMPAPGYAQTRDRESADGDRKWEEQVTNGPCQKLKDRRTDPPAIVAACATLYANIPLCMDYKNFAQVWLDSRAAHDHTLAFQVDVINGLGKGEDETLVHKSPDYREKLKGLFLATLNVDQKKWQNGKSWGEFAYTHCMAGHFF